ncbi:hypothetical protein BPT24_263 [Tenacibaculum phage pT24]|uniref:DUF2786 domain-containing protein n=1 Tax=Tenacibaculum phage pT24 TaxID=1880590 RepID=A0A1B4XX53_9CAUD|nr:hypothetical protein HYP10_gp265 [Tenacibaculum phage pT24]BAV39381.1 hypothetical protein BPT24_263 [Tenacibaculum phage pT24]
MEKSKNSVLDKIEKLLSLANNEGASQGEIENAMKMAEKLMLKHDIEAVDIEIGSLEVNETKVQFEEEKGFYPKWRYELLKELALANMCEHFYSDKRTAVNVMTGMGWKYVVRKTGEYSVTIIGRKDRRKTVFKMYDLCSKMLPELAKQRWKEYRTQKVKSAKEMGIDATVSFLVKHDLMFDRRVFFNSYLKGAFKGIVEKIESNLDELSPAEKDKYQLVVAKNDLVVRNYLTEKYPSVKSVNRRKGNISAEAYRMGESDAKNIGEKQLNA